MTKRKGKKPVTPVKESSATSHSEQSGPVTNGQIPQYRFGDIFESDNNDEEALLDAKLARLGLARKRIPKDGACLFRAVAEQLYYTQTMHHNVRKKCVDYIEQHKDTYEPFVCVGGEMPYDHYCFEMRKSNTWGGEIEISAMHYTFGLDFQIFSPSHPEPTLIGDGKHHRILLGFYGNHYDCVFPQKSLDAEQFCQGVVYDLLDKALGVRLPRDSKYRNVGLECWTRELQEQQQRDQHLATELAHQEHKASTHLSGFSKKVADSGNGWQVKNRRQPPKAHTAEEPVAVGPLSNSGKRPDSKSGSKPAVNGKPGVRSKGEPDETEFMQQALRAVAEHEQAEARERQERVLMMRDQANFPSLATARPAWKPLPTAPAAAAAVPGPEPPSADEPAVNAAAPQVPADKKEPTAGVWSAQPRNWSAVVAPKAPAPAAYRPPMLASAESVPGVTTGPAAVQAAPVDQPSVQDSIAPKDASDDSAPHDRVFFRVESLKEVIVDTMSPPPVRKPSPVTDDPAVVRVFSAADAPANFGLAQFGDVSSPVRFAFDTGTAVRAPTVAASLSVGERPAPRSVSTQDFQLPQSGRSPVRLSDSLIISFSKVSPPSPHLVVGNSRIVATGIWPFKRSTTSDDLAQLAQAQAQTVSTIEEAPKTMFSEEYSAEDEEANRSVDGVHSYDDRSELYDEQLSVEVHAADLSRPTRELSAMSPSFELPAAMEPMPVVYHPPVMYPVRSDPAELTIDPDMHFVSYEGHDPEYAQIADRHYRTTAPRPDRRFSNEGRPTPYMPMQNGFPQPWFHPNYPFHPPVVFVDPMYYPAPFPPPMYSSAPFTSVPASSMQSKGPFNRAQRKQYV